MYVHGGRGRSKRRSKIKGLSVAKTEALSSLRRQRHSQTHQRTSSYSTRISLVRCAAVPLICSYVMGRLTRVPGYSRIILAVASLYYMPLHPRTCSLLYSISCLLDALDGYAARYFQQSTRFGAVLDMVTDRCTTACLLVFLSSAWPRWALLFQGLISLDLASHYMHMYATLTMGSVDSHKKVDENRSKILYLYYNNKVRHVSPFSQLIVALTTFSSDRPVHVLCTE